MDKFLNALMNLIVVEANNNDYYVDGYVDALALQELINEHFPEYEFKYDAYCRWHPRDPNKHDNPLASLLKEAYNETIIQQLKAESLLREQVFKSPTGELNKPGERAKFIVYGTKTGRFTNDGSFKKDG